MHINNFRTAHLLYQFSKKKRSNFFRELISKNSIIAIKPDIGRNYLNFSPIIL